MRYVETGLWADVRELPDALRDTLAGVPTLFVRRGLRPSGVAPDETMTRFTWTLGAHGAKRP